MRLPTFLTAALVALAGGAGALAVLKRGEPRRPTDLACGPTLSTPGQVGVREAGAATLCLINRERTGAGLAPLASNGLLATAALAHSRDMVARRYFEHEAPGGRTPQDRIRDTGWGRGTSSSTGENIAWGEGEKATPAAIVEQWMSSPPHREDILRPAFREIGVGIALGAPAGRGRRSGATYTTNFGGSFDPSLGSDGSG